MWSKILKLAGVLLLAGTLLVSTYPVFAAEAPGTGPELAFTVPTGAVSIPAGGELWFAFGYIGDGSTIVVDMAGNPALTTFTVWTPANVQTRSMNQSVTPIGAGSVMSYTSNPDQVWNGSFNKSGTYYVVVDESSRAPGSFVLTVTGSGVSTAGQPMPSSAAASTPAPAAAAVATPAPSAAVAAPAATVTSTVASGTGPNNTFTGPRGWLTTNPGTSTWYAFQYLGDGSQRLIDMKVYPSTAASFAVWTKQDLQYIGTPVGIGSANPNNANDLLWSGSFNVPGTYYVVVAQSGAGGYNLTIAGSGVSFSH